MHNAKQTKTLIILAFFAVYVFWGGTYLGMKFALESFPPFIMAGIRHFTAGVILTSFAYFKKENFPKFNEIRNAAIVGTLLLVGGNGLVAFAEVRVPSSIASLIIASVPIWISLLNWVGNDHKRPGIWETIALSLGILGIALMAFQGQDTSQNIDLLGIAILLIASLSWSFGSLFSRNQSMPKSSFYSVSIQMLTGGVLLFILSFSLQEAQTVEWLAITPKALWAMLYLIFFGSILAYTAYLWLLKQVNPTLASTNAFVNPVVALGLGWFFANERLSTQALFASILIVIAVVILTFKKGK